MSRVIWSSESELALRRRIAAKGVQARAAEATRAARIPAPAVRELEPVEAVLARRFGPATKRLHVMMAVSR